MVSGEMCLDEILVTKHSLPTTKRRILNSRGHNSLAIKEPFNLLTYLFTQIVVIIRFYKSRD